MCTGIWAHASAQVLTSALVYSPLSQALQIVVTLPFFQDFGFPTSLEGDMGAPTFHVPFLLPAAHGSAHG